MKLQTKIYVGLGIAAIFAVGILGGAAWSNHKIAKLESAVETAKQLAEGSKQLADKRELEAAEFKQKIEYLERQLADIQTIARKQDEELEKLNDNSARARSDVERARRTRSIAATADELCQKLAELGHGCDQ
jgi:DNA-binding helix-hairpin-helix protein with protein kinase domain